jgi:hypothetical protein
LDRVSRSGIAEVSNVGQWNAKRRLAGACVAAWILASGGAAMGSEDEALRDVVLDYAEGWYTGDDARLARALHPQMLRRRVVTEVLSRQEVVQAMDAETMIAAAREGQGKDLDPSLVSLRTAVLDRHGDMATARVVSPLYVDYLQLVRWEGRWVVLSAVWGTVAAPGE